MMRQGNDGVVKASAAMKSGIIGAKPVRLTNDA
jgi:hypothetical protein